MPAPEGRLSKAVGDAALAPVLGYNPPDADIASLKEAITHSGNEDFAEARASLQKITDPTVKKFALWYIYRSGAADTTSRGDHRLSRRQPALAEPRHAGGKRRGRSVLA